MSFPRWRAGCRWARSSARRSREMRSSRSVRNRCVSSSASSWSRWGFPWSRGEEDGRGSFMPDRNDERGTSEARKDHLFMFGELTAERAQEIAEKLLADWDREYTLFINSDGGSSFDALALVNLLKMHGRVDTVCLGVALSGAA